MYMDEMAEDIKPGAVYEFKVGMLSSWAHEHIDNFGYIVLDYRKAG